MIIPITYPSALQFWMDSNLLNFSDSFSLEKRVLSMLPQQYSFCPNNLIVTKLSHQYGFTFPVHFMAPDRTHRRFTSLLTCSVRPQELPLASFIQTDTLKMDNNSNEPCHIYIATPELCFLQAASHLSLLELIKLGYDLTATYLPDPTADFYQSNRKPICSKESILSYIGPIADIRGIKNARMAVQHIVNASNSPMETRLCILMTLPIHLGGYGIPKPELNKRIILSAMGKELLQRGYCICDAVWTTEKIIMEYDSNLTHLSPTQHELDKARQSALTLSGYQVISLTADNIRSLSKADQAFTTLRRKLGLRRQSSRLDQFMDQRRFLYNFLMK